MQAADCSLQVAARGMPPVTGLVDSRFFLTLCLYSDWKQAPPTAMSAAPFEM